jgi:hypothetical protein
LPFRQASVERITVWTARHLAAPTRFNPTIAGSEPVGTGSALAISGGSGARAVMSGKRVFISRKRARPIASSASA